MTSEDLAAGRATVVQVRGLTKRFGEVAAVRDLTLEVYAGEVLGFLGDNGSGKTTTMKMLLGLHTSSDDAGSPAVAVKPRTRTIAVFPAALQWEDVVHAHHRHLAGDTRDVCHRSRSRR